MLPISHDEVVHGKGSLLRKMPGDRWQQLANLRAYLAYMWAHPGKQLLFMGARVRPGVASGPSRRELDWWLLDDPGHRGRADAGARPQPDLPGDAGALGARRRPRRLPVDRRQRRRPQPFSFVRRAAGAAGPGLRRELRRRCRTTTTGSGCRAGAWREVLNTDAEVYGGSGVGNLGGVEAVAGEWHGQPAYADDRRAAAGDRLVPAARLTDSGAGGALCGIVHDHDGGRGNSAP